MARMSLLNVALAAAGTASAISYPHAPSPFTAPRDLNTPRDVEGSKSGFVSMPVTRSVKTSQTLNRRDNDVPLYNMSSVSYLIELNIGTPPQSVKVAIDTGSDELWVNPQCSTSGNDELERQCHLHGKYDPDDSSTATLTTVENYIPYGKGEVNMRYVLDNITLSDSTLKISQQVFGAATSSSELNEGILGLSYGYGTNLEYPNMVDELFFQNYTNTRAFSIALGDKDFHNGGTLIFGGVDTKKFTGELVQRPVLGPQFGERLKRYWIDLTGIAYDDGDNIKSYSMDTVPIVLDSGSTLSYLPRSVVSAMASDLDAQYDRQSDLYIVDCRKAQTDDTMDFEFGNATIKVPMYEFIWEAATNICVLGAIGVGETDISLLGDSMMRAGYFVFDQDNDAIHMAQYANCGENEQTIPAGGNAAELFQGDCSLSDTQLNAVGGGSGGSGSSGNDDDSAAGSLVGNLAVVFGLAAGVACALV